MGKKYIQNERISVALFAVAMLVYAIVYLTKTSFGAAMVHFEAEQILTKTQTGTINAVFYLAYAPFQIVGGIAADKYSPFKLISIGLIGAVLSNALILITQNYYFLMIVWAFNGAVQFGIWPATFKIVSSVLAPVHRKNAIFYSTFAGTIGMILSYIVASIVSGWRSNFIVCVVLLGVSTVVWIALSRYFNNNLVEEEYESHGVAHLPEFVRSEKKHHPDFLKMCFTSGLMFLLPAVIAGSIFSVAMQTFVPSMLKDSYDTISLSLASALTTLPIIVGIFGKFTMKYIYVKKSYNESFVLFLIMTCLMIPLSVMLFVGKINYWIIVIMVCLVMLVASAGSLVAVTYIPLRFAKMGKGATVAGTVNAMTALSIVLSNYISPRIADKFGGWTEVIIAWILFALFSALVYLLTSYTWNKFIKKQS